MASLVVAKVCTRIARVANCRVDRVSSVLTDAGDTVTTNIVRVLPPSESWSIRVSFELRYGTCFLPFASNALTQLLSVDKLYFKRIRCVVCV